MSPLVLELRRDSVSLCIPGFSTRLQVECLHVEDIEQEVLLIEVAALYNQLVPGIGKGHAIDPLPMHSA